MRRAVGLGVGLGVESSTDGSVAGVCGGGCVSTITDEDETNNNIFC